jgi:hypothetical protein
LLLYFFLLIRDKDSTAGNLGFRKGSYGVVVVVVVVLNGINGLG